MRRREFIAGLGSAAVWPKAAQAQQGDRTRRVGVLMGADESDPEYRLQLAGLSRGSQSLAGAMAATFVLTLVGPVRRSAGCGPSRRNWSAYSLM
jgi:hypothetical protein